MERLLEQLQQEYPAVMAAVYENFTASLRLSTATDEDLLQQAETLLRRITVLQKKKIIALAAVDAEKQRM